MKCFNQIWITESTKSNGLQCEEVQTDAYHEEEDAFPL